MALDFSSAINMYVNLGHPADFDFAIDESFTICARLKYPERGHNQMIVRKDKVGATRDVVLLFVFTAGQVALQIGDGAEFPIVSSASSNFNDSNYHSVVAVRDIGNDKLYIYGDGEPEGNVADTTLNAIDDDGPYWIADNPRIPATADYSEGIILELRIYKSKAFSAAEAKIFHSARGADSIVDSLVGRWLMNEKPDGQAAAGANAVIDISGNGNHGTPVNSPIYRGAPVKLLVPRVSIWRKPYIVIVTFSATSSAISSITASLTLGKVEALTGTSSATTSVTASLTLGKVEALTGTSSATSSIIASLTLGLTATASATSSITASLTLGKVEALTGTSSATTSVTATLTLGKIEALTATSSAVSITQGSLTVVYPLLDIEISELLDKYSSSLLFDKYEAEELSDRYLASLLFDKYEAEELRDRYYTKSCGVT